MLLLRLISINKDRDSQIALGKDNRDDNAVFANTETNGRVIFMEKQLGTSNVFSQIEIYGNNCGR